MTATLTAVPLLAFGEYVRQITVDCPHGTTTLTVMAPNLEAMQRQEAAATGLAILNHHAEEDCSCTGELRRRYVPGVAS